METVIIAPAKQRRRPRVSCTLCRKRKTRCNRERPCSNCRRSRTGNCVYEDDRPYSLSPGHYPTPESQAPMRLGDVSSFASHPSQSQATSWSGASKSSERPSQDYETTRLKHRIRQLEDQLARATSGPVHGPGPDSNDDTTHFGLGGRTFHLHYKRDASEQPEPIAHNLSHKSRLFGQSHWVVSVAYLIHDYFNILDPYIQDQPLNAWVDIEKCKLIARRIKARRAPPWPSQPTSQLPSRTISDALVHHYLQKTETLYRILHIPTFRRKYEEIWVPGKARDINFLIQLKLVLAIGAVTYDDQFSLRTSAIRWVYEAQVWISGPKYKTRLNIQAMQTNLLLLFAQEQVGVSGDLPWVSAGALLRKAIHMGLHRDPSYLPQRTLFEAEMHRRVWNTILEVNIQSSLTSGGPALISLDDFDTLPPGNFDDDQLEVENPIPSLSEERTQMSFAIALRRTFSQRLAVVNFLNNLRSPGTYKGTLQLDTELRTAYRELGRTLREYRKPSDGLPSSCYETKAVDFLMHRYFCALHIPYFGSALRGTAYAYSQKSVVESSLKLWRTAWPTSTTQANDINSSDDSDFPRLIACSSGFYPSVTIHAAFIIALELRSQLQEDSICPAPLRPDLLAVLEEAKAWCLKVINAGETSVKGYLLISLVVTQVQGMMSGLGEDKIQELLIKAMTEVGQKCLPILEQMAAIQGQSTEVADELHRATPADIIEDWDFMTDDALLNLGGTEPMSWIFNDEFNLDMSLF